MKNYSTSKFVLMMAFLFLWTGNSFGQNYQEVRKWDFLTWSQETLDNLAADVVSSSPKWLVQPREDNGEVERYKNKGTSVATLVANGVEIEETKDILFPTDLSEGGLTLRVNHGDDGIQFGSKEKWITVKGRTAGQKLEVIVRSTNTNPRGIDQITNMTGKVGSETYNTEQADILYEFTVTADGDVRFRTSDGIILKSITVYEEVVGTGDSKIAFVCQPTGYSSHGYEPGNDPIYLALLEEYDVEIIDVATLDEVTVMALVDYDLVYVSEAIAGGEAKAVLLTEIVNMVPMLNQKSFLYGSGSNTNRWKWGIGRNPSPISTSITVKVPTHPIFEGVVMDENGVCELYDGTDTGSNLVQGYDTPVELIANDPILAIVGVQEYLAIHEHGSGVNQYMLIPLSSDKRSTLTDNAIKLVMNAASYLIGTKEAKELERVETPVISYDDQEELITYVTITCGTEGASIYYTLDGSTPTISKTLYDGNPIEITKPLTVKAFAVKEGMINSDVATEEDIPVTGYSYVARNRTLLYSNFKDLPESWGSERDIFAKDKSGTTNVAGFTVGSGGQRVRLQTQSVGSLGSSYGPETEDASEATSWAISFLAGSVSGYISYNTPLQGPFDVNLWWCGVGSSNRIKVSIKTEEDEDWTDLETLTQGKDKGINRDVISYDGNDLVYIKVSAANGTNMLIFDMKVLGEGEEPDPARKIAYLYEEDYSSTWSLEEDPIYKALSEKHNVTAINVNNENPEDVDDLIRARYELVYASEAISGTHTYGLALKELVNRVPMFNQKSFFYGSGANSVRWGWGTGKNPKDKIGVTAINIEADYLNHPIFEGLTIDENGICELFTESVTGTNQLQGYEPNAEIENDPVLAKVSDGGSNLYNLIHERISENEEGEAINTYMLIGLSSDQIINTLNEDGVQIVMNAIEYLLKTYYPIEVAEVFVDTPVITCTNNEENSGIVIAIECETAGATIHYTVDGSNPTTSSPVYTEEIPFYGEDITVKAMGVKEGYRNSEIAEETFVNEYFVPRRKTLLHANFDDEPGIWGVGDIITQGTTLEVVQGGGFTIGSLGQRVHISTESVGKVGGNYGPATEEDADATNCALSFLAGQANAYLITPEPIQGPFDIALWWCMAKGSSYTEKVKVSVQAEETEEWIEVGVMSTKSLKSITKQFVSYDGNEKVLVRLDCVSENDANNNAMIFDMRLLGVGQDKVSAPRFSDSVDPEDGNIHSVSITSSTSGATIYYTLDGTDPTTDSEEYVEPVKITVTEGEAAIVKAIAVKAKMDDSNIATKEIQYNSISSEFINKVVSSRAYYTVGGVEIAEPAKGINIMKTTYEDGTVEINKVVIK